MIDSRKNSISLATRDHFTVQTGSIPTGVTGSKAKYPVNSAEISINHDQQVLLIKPISITQDFTIGLTGDWSKKIRSGNSIQLQRGTIDSEYTVKTLKYLPSDDISTISLSHKRNVVNLFDPFIHSTGYDLPAIDTYIKLNRRVESPNNVSSLVKDFSVKLIQESDPLRFSTKVSWLLDPKVSAAKLRWRSTPRVASQSNLLFDVVTPGEYKSVPKLNVVSVVGRKAEIEMSGYINTIDIVDNGSLSPIGYSYANIEVVGGGGTGAAISANVTGGYIDSITINNAGTGYTSFPKLIVTGPPGSTGAFLKINSINFDKVNTVQQGGNYLISPSITIDINPTDVVTHAQIIAYTDLQNNGRIDYIRVTNGGSDYQDATVTITGGLNDAIAYPIITNGTITDIKVAYSGCGYDHSNIDISSTTGHDATAIGNVDLYSKWIYEDVNYLDKFIILEGFNYDIPYEIEILASEDEQFRGLIKYSNLTHFQLNKDISNPYITYKPFTLLSKSPNYGETIFIDDMPYSFQLLFNHDVFIASTGITATLHNYTDNTNTIINIPGGYSGYFSILNFDFSGYTFTPGDYDITFNGGILNDTAFKMEAQDWYFTVIP